MEVTTPETARVFRERADPLLLEHEAKNNLILGLTAILIEDERAFDVFRGWVVEDQGVPLVAGAVIGPNNLILTDARSHDAVRCLAAAVDDIPGVVGPVPWISTFVAARSERATRTMRQGVFAVERVNSPDVAEGRSGPAGREQIGLITDWFCAFASEAVGLDPDPDEVRRRFSKRITTQSRDSGVWVHEVEGAVVSMSSHSGPTPHGIRIAAVYTAPEHRRKGYATTLVARQSQWLLDSGHRFCFLYTDLSNPTSNAIYRRIGYRQVAESHEYEFNPTT